MVSSLDISIYLLELPRSSYTLCLLALADK